MAIQARNDQEEYVLLAIARVRFAKYAPAAHFVLLLEHGHGCTMAPLLEPSWCRN
jgi:hypothetical protein